MKSSVLGSGIGVWKSRPESPESIVVAPPVAMKFATWRCAASAIACIAARLLLVRNRRRSIVTGGLVAIGDYLCCEARQQFGRHLQALDVGRKMDCLS